MRWSMPSRLILPLLAVAALTACEGGTRGPGGPEITVMTRNLYVGAEITRILTVEDPNDIPIEVALLWQTVMATDFAERAEALADEIEDAEPHLVGLQEVSLFRYQTPGDFLVGNPTAAANVVLDFLQLLLDALDARGLNYSVAHSVTDFDIEIPILNATYGLDDIRLTDHEVILVNDDADITINATDGGNFAYALPVEPMPGVTIYVTRGWASVDAQVGDAEFRFVSTHPEPATMGGMVIPDLVDLQHAQAAELIGVLRASTLPLIVVGDLNSPADGSHTSTYAGLLAIGLKDVWTAIYPAELGYTCCQIEDLTNATSQLATRIDLVLFSRHFVADDADIVGELPGDMTSGGLWPSDHAGVWGTLVYR